MERRLRPDRLELRRAHLVDEVGRDRVPGRPAGAPAFPVASSRRVAVALAVVAAAVIVAPAFGLERHVLDLFSLADTGGAPAGSVVLPGRPIEPDVLLRGTLEDQPQIRADTVREVAAAGSGRSALTLVAALDADGAVCVASKNRGVMGDFECLDEAAGERQAIFRSSASGGSNAKAVDWVTVVGFVRSDVAKIVGVSASGKNISVPINTWLGFGFSSPAREAPASLRAYDAGGKLVDESSLTPIAPLCGGDAGPCG